MHIYTRFSLESLKLKLVTTAGVLQVGLNDCVVQSSKSIYSNPLTNVVLANPFFDCTQLQISTYLRERIAKC
jgi:hypothetical protein